MTEKMVEYVRLLQNPYAKLSMIDDVEDDNVASALDSKRTYFKKLQNPCAYDSIFGEEEGLQLLLIKDSNSAKVADENRPGISKKEFVDSCRRIFLQYVPSAEGRVLRSHYRDFITRNENNSPDFRAKLLTELIKYDLTRDGNFKPHFNRELSVLKKLQAIEKAARNS